MSSSKKFTCKGTLRQVFFWLRPRTPSPLYTLYTCIQYTYIHTGKGEGGAVEPERREEGQTTVNKAGSKL
jgi:hypothetical protein